MKTPKKLKTVMIEITDRCNLHCRHCMNRPDCMDIEMSLAEYSLVMNKIGEYGVEKVFISGGEPLLHSNISDIINMCELYPDVIFVITTNGLLLSENTMRDIEKRDNLTLQFSIDGISKFAYESIRGDNTFDVFIDKIRIWKSSKIKQGLARTCINKHNVKEIAQIYTFCLQNRLIPSFLFVDALGNGKSNWEELDTSLAEKIGCIGEINRLNNKYNYSVTPPEAPATCNFTEGDGVCSLLVRSGGRVAPCQFFYDDSIGNIFTDSIHEILTHRWLEDHKKISAKRKEFLSKTPRCQGCKIKDGCNFGCVGKANELGNIMSYDGLCELRTLTTICYSNQLITYSDNVRKINAILPDMDGDLDD